MDFRISAVRTQCLAVTALRCLTEHLNNEGRFKFEAVQTVVPLQAPILEYACYKYKYSFMTDSNKQHEQLLRFVRLLQLLLSCMYVCTYLYNYTYIYICLHVYIDSVCVVATVFPIGKVSWEPYM